MSNQRMSGTRKVSFEANRNFSSFAATAANHLRGQLNLAEAEIAELKSKLAAQKSPDNGGDGQDDADDPSNVGDELDPSDIDSPKKPKKGKKARDKTDDKEHEPGTPDERAPEPVEASTSTVIPGAVTITSFKQLAAALAPPLLTTAQAIFADVKLRVTAPPEGSRLSLDAYQRHVAASAALVVHASRVARAETSAPIASLGPQPAFEGQSNQDPEYWRRVNASARAALREHYASHGRKLED